jgi:hypothetical protein
LVRRIELNPVATRVITGPIGSGKSTELMVIAAALDELQDVSAFVVDVSVVHDLSDLQEGSLIAAAGLWLESQGFKGRELDKLRQAAYGTDNPKISDLFQLNFTRQSDAPKSTWPTNRGILRVPRSETQIARQLGATLRDAVLAIPGGRKRTYVFLFDSLDRVDDPDGFRTVLERDAAAMHDYGFGAILTAPVTTLWSHSADLRSLCDSWDTLPYVDPVKDKEARAFFQEVLARRLDPALFPGELRSTLVDCSGGVLRDLIDLARNAVEEAYMNGREVITADDIEASIARFARSLSLGLGSVDVARLIAVRNSHQISVFDELSLSLLENRQLLEHHDPESGPYFEPHPALHSLLEHLAKAS